LIPLVEVVGGEQTAPAAIEAALAFYKAIGKRPIHIRREVAGHLDQLGPPLESWWDELGAPRLTPEIRQALTAGVADEAEGRDIATLAAERDRFLLDLLALKRARSGA